MNRNIVFGYERDSPLNAINEYILYFSKKELEVAFLSHNGKEDKEIAAELKISIDELARIRMRIRKKALALIGQN
jgi:DNA-binding CsgD family transcriptional regulator